MKRLGEIGAQRTREARGEAVRYMPVVPDSDAQFTETTSDLYREGYEYYRTKRAQHPNSPNRYIFSSLAQQMAFFPFGTGRDDFAVPDPAHGRLKGGHPVLE